MEKEVKSRLDVESPKLLKRIKEYLETEDQTVGHFTCLGIIKHQGKVFLSSLDAFNLVWKLTRYFEQVAVATCQYGDIALVNEKDGKNSEDTPVTNNCGTHQTWFNACVSTRLSNFSRDF